MMAIAGSAVGLGNIWRFPYLAGQNGGAAFLIIYIALIVIVGLPLMMAEYSIGRATKLGPIKSLEALAPRTKWKYMGYFSIVIGFVLMGFYTVVSGWTLKFFVDSVVGGFSGMTSGELSGAFTSFTESVWQPIVYALIFVSISAYIVSRGVEKGIEKFNKILMPALFGMLILLCVNSFTLDGWNEGLTFLFKPDWSAVTWQTVIDALGQVFFSLSLGMGVMITYASYVVKDENMVKSKSIVAIIGTSVAVLAGVAIFPAVFTFGLEPSEGASLVFIALPSVFAQMAGGQIVSILFFAMISIAALTSVISIMEVLILIFIEQFKISRKRATAVVTVVIIVLVVLCAASDEIFSLFDTASSNYMMTLYGILTAIFVGWVFNKKLLYDTFTSGGRYSTRIYPAFLFAIRYIVPAGIVVIILSKLGIF